jgi:hypothetical protein
MCTHTNAFNAVLLAILKRSKRGSKYASLARIAILSISSVPKKHQKTGFAGHQRTISLDF